MNIVRIMALFLSFITTISYGTCCASRTTKVEEKTIVSTKSKTKNPSLSERLYALEKRVSDIESSIVAIDTQLKKIIDDKPKAGEKI